MIERGIWLSHAPLDRDLQPRASCALRIQCPGKSCRLDGRHAHLLQSHNIVDRDHQIPIERLWVGVDVGRLACFDFLDSRELDPSGKVLDPVAEMDDDMTRTMMFVPDVERY